MPGNAGFSIKRITHNHSFKMMAVTTHLKMTALESLLNIAANVVW
jgi:hypothetical protein